MDQHVIINGQKTVVKVEQDTLLKDIVQMAINQTDNASYKPADFNCIYKDNYLAQHKSISEQIESNTGLSLHIEGDIIYICHLSKDVRIYKVNPYRYDKSFNWF